MLEACVQCVRLLCSLHGSAQELYFCDLLVSSTCIDVGPPSANNLLLYFATRSANIWQLLSGPLLALLSNDDRLTTHHNIISIIGDIEIPV